MSINNPCGVFLASVPVAPGQPVAREWAERLVRNVQSSSFPELAKTDIRIDQFTSDSDYFQARFIIPRFMEPSARNVRDVRHVPDGASRKIRKYPETAIVTQTELSRSTVDQHVGC